VDPKGKVAIITGAARIGQTVAMALAGRGCGLAITYRGSRDAAEATAEKARASGVAAIAVQADATNEPQVEAAVQEVARSLGHVDILINMASIYSSTPEANNADWARMMDANARSVFLFSTHAAPLMKQAGGGRIINFADWLPISGRPRYKGYMPYYTSKAAVIAVTEALALELAPSILVNSIAPGPILAPQDLTVAETAEVMRATPLERWGGPDEIAKTVMFLIETEFVTGECIRVDGGRHLR
jgi:NAD(P)-dependent dehydrogenase (short-subunit alcohol dehydrogenase family)